MRTPPPLAHLCQPGLHLGGVVADDVRPDDRQVRVAQAHARECGLPLVQRRISCGDEARGGGACTVDAAQRRQRKVVAQAGHNLVLPDGLLQLLPEHLAGADLRRVGHQVCPAEPVLRLGRGVHLVLGGRQGFYGVSQALVLGAAQLLAAREREMSKDQAGGYS